MTICTWSYTRVYEITLEPGCFKNWLDSFPVNCSKFENWNLRIKENNLGLYFLSHPVFTIISEILHQSRCVFVAVLGAHVVREGKFTYLLHIHKSMPLAKDESAITRVDVFHSMHEKCLWRKWKVEKYNLDPLVFNSPNARVWSFHLQMVWVVFATYSSFPNSVHLRIEIYWQPFHPTRYDSPGPCKPSVTVWWLRIILFLKALCDSKYRATKQSTTPWHHLWVRTYVLSALEDFVKRVTHETQLSWPVVLVDWGRSHLLTELTYPHQPRYWQWTVIFE